jgi:prophage regulatory protein
LSADNWDFDFAVIDGQRLQTIVPYSLSQLTRLEKEGRFPRRLKLGPGRVGWMLSEVYEWIEQRKAERDPVT